MASKQHWVNAPSLLYIIFIQLFLSVHSKTCNISSLGGFVQRGFCHTEKRKGFCSGGGLLSGGLLSWTQSRRTLAPHPGGPYSRVRHTPVGRIRTLEYML